MRFRTGFSALCLGGAVTAQAGQFDGLYAPTGPQWSCNPDDLRRDGRALRIACSAPDLQSQDTPF
ncbi:hypothetical protein [Roseibaca calidilacus]|uniref:hypothetical protein n=1 Tax=Roseibaca calidilacus TaxID=1666912 RepID=UPI001146A25E|nr:hypothetical protein [Roseibaca calidilacus]